LRFWYRNPLQEGTRSLPDSIGDDEDEDGGVSLGTGVRTDSRSSVSMPDAPTPQQNEEGVRLPNGQPPPSPEGLVAALAGGASGQQRPALPDVQESTQNQDDRTLAPPHASLTTQRSGSDQSMDAEASGRDAIFDRPTTHRSSSSATPPEDPRIEIEAVVSCSSDGLVVILRRAKPLVPHTLGATEAPYYANGIFASPWAPEPVMPPAVYEAAVAPSSPSSAPSTADSGFMAAIRDVAVFAWSLTGINGSLAQYARGTPAGEASPPDGLPVWDPEANVDPLANETYNGFLGSKHRPWAGPTGEPSEAKKDEELGSSDEEILWKRTPTLSRWRRPKRRAHQDAFGEDGNDGVDGEDQHGGRKKPTRSSSGSGPGGASVSGADTPAGST